MPRSRFVRPDVVRVDISDGDWLILKRRLTAGEQRTVFARVVKTTPVDEAQNGRVMMDPLQASLATVLAYLVDWSLVDDEGMPVVIRHKSLDEINAVLDGLDVESYKEIVQACTAHERRMDAERSAEKNGTGGETRSSAILPSPSDAAGATTGSSRSTPMSMTSSAPSS